MDIHSVREPVQNDDGSIDVFGILTGIEKSSREEFEERDLSEFYRTDLLEATAAETGEAGLSSQMTNWLSALFGKQKSFAEIFKKYERYGITYEEPSQNNTGDAVSGIGNVYYEGQLVNAFIDQKENGGVFSFHSADGGDINVQTVYDSRGKLTGVKAAALR